MAYKCRICGVNEVNNQGDICELCAVLQDPYMQSSTQSQSFANDDTYYNQDNTSCYSPKSTNRKILIHGGSSISDQAPYGNDITPQVPIQPTPIYQTEQVNQYSPNNVGNAAPPISSSSASQPLTTGIVKNISVNEQKKSALSKWIRALFTGAPFTLDDEITMFQVFPDFSGTSLNALGNACDQVIVYGKLNNGAICENNDVEVYGHRDSNNNIIAKTIKNKATGTTVTPAGSIGQGVVLIITAIILGLLTIGGLAENIFAFIILAVAFVTLTKAFIARIKRYL